MKAHSDFPDINKRPPIGHRSDGSEFRVLVADDSVFIIKQLTQILTSESFNIVGTAVNGEEALEKYKELHPNVDLVTMDITMPKMDGITALTKIMEFDKKAVIIMISALGKQDLVKQAL